MPQAAMNGAFHLKAPKSRKSSNHLRISKGKPSFVTFASRIKEEKTSPHSHIRPKKVIAKMHEGMYGEVNSLP